MGLLGDGAIGHGPRFKPGDDGIYALHLLQWNTLFGIIEIHQAPQIAGLFLIHHLRILFEHLVVALLGGLLQHMDRLRVIAVGFPGASHLMPAHAVQGQIRIEPQRVKGLRVQGVRLLRDIIQRDTAHTADGVGKVFIYNVRSDTDGLKNLGALIGLNRGNSHLGSNLYNAVKHRRIVILHCCVVILIQHSAVDLLADRLQSQIRVDRAGAVAQKRRKMMDLSRFPGFQHDGKGGALLRLYEMLMDSGDCQQGRDGHMVLIHAPVCQDQDICPVSVGSVHLHKQMVNRLGQLRVFVVGNGNLRHLKALNLHILDLQHICVCQDRVFNLQNLAVDGLLVQQVSIFSHIHRGRCDDLLPNRVDGRICHLGKKLLKIVKQRLVFLGQHGQGRVDAHGADSLGAVQGYIADGGPVFLVGIAKGLLEPCQFLVAVLLHPDIGNPEIGQLYQVTVQPLSVGLAFCVHLFQFVIVDNSPLECIHQEHLSRVKPFLLHNLSGIDIQNPDLGGKDQIAILRNVVPGGAKPVPVKNCADQVAVGKDDGGRAVPGLHHGGIILVKILFLLVHGPVVGPGLRDRDHNRQGQLHTAHHQKFQRIIQHSGVRAGRVYHRQHLMQLPVEILAGHGLLPGQHLVRIAPDRVDLTVMDNQPVGMGSLPAWVRIGAEPGVHRGDGRIIVRALQILKEGAKLPYQEHSLIHDGAAG